MENVVASSGRSGRGMSLRYPLFVWGGAFAGIYWNKKSERVFRSIITYDNEGLSLSSRHYGACISFINRFTLQKECL